MSLQGWERGMCLEQRDLVPGSCRDQGREEAAAVGGAFHPQQGTLDSVAVCSTYVLARSFWLLCGRGIEK